MKTLNRKLQNHTLNNSQLLTLKGGDDDDNPQPSISITPPAAPIVYPELDPKKEK